MLGVLLPSEIEEILRNNSVGRLGCEKDGQIYITPITYIYERNSILCHSFEGQKIAWMRSNRAVGFQMDVIADAHNWKSIVAYGEYQEISDPAMKALAAKQFDDSQLREKASLTALPPNEVMDLQPTPHGVSVFYKIVFSSITGRFEKAATMR